MERITKPGFKFTLLNVMKGLTHYVEIDEILNKLSEYEDRCSWVPVSVGLPKLGKVEGQSEDVNIAVQYATDLPGEKPTVCCGYYLDGSWWSYSEHGCNKIGDKWEGDRVVSWCRIPKF